MRKLFALLLVVVMTAGIMLPFASSLDAADIGGNVADRNGIGLDDATVNIYEASDLGTPVDTATTVGGIFTMADLDQKNYKLTVVLTGYGVTYCSLGNADEHGMYDLPATSDISDIFIMMDTSTIDVTIEVIGERDIPRGVKVEVSEGAHPPVVKTTGDDGKCTFTSLDRTKVYTVKFTKETCGVSNLLDFHMSNGNITMNFFDVDGSSTEYKVMMSPAYGSVVGHVTNDNDEMLGEVVIVFTSKVTGDEVRVVTNRGEYEVKSLLTGDYTVTVSRSDYKTHKEELNVSEGVNEFSFELESTDDTYIFGLDLPHSLMIGGVIIGVLVIFVVSVYRYNLGRKDTVDTSDDTVTDILEQDDE